MTKIKDLKPIAVFCPLCDDIFVIHIEKDDDNHYEGMPLVCPPCTKNSAENQNGGIHLKENPSLDLFPGDA